MRGRSYKLMLLYGLSSLSMCLMNRVAWNIRGCANEQSLLQVKNLVSSYRLSLLGLLETKIGEPRAREFVASLRGWNFHCVSSNGLSGGIWLFWNTSMIHTEVLREDRYFIHAKIFRNGQPPFLLVLIYASTINSIRDSMWEFFSNLNIETSTVWFLLGDFNDIVKIVDQLRSLNLYLNRSLNLQRHVNALNPMDLGAVGHRFTWRKKCLQVRLDRVYTNLEGRCCFPNWLVINLPFRHSDHCPFLLNFEKPIYRLSDRPFRYEAA